MPSNLVKKKSDEKLWEEAKKKYKAKKEKSGAAKEKWAYITTIYESMKKGGHKAKGGTDSMKPNLRTLLANAVTADFITQAVSIITALEDPVPATDAPPAKRAAPVPSSKPVDPESQEAKDFVGYTNFLAEVEKNLKHSMGMMLSYSQSFQKELKQTMRLFDAKKSKLTMGDIRSMAQLVDAVQKVMRAVDTVSDRFEFLGDGVRKMAEMTNSPADQKATDKEREKPITNIEKEMNTMDKKNKSKSKEVKTKLGDFFKDIKTKFGSKPQAASVMLAKALVTTAKTLSE